MIVFVIPGQPVAWSRSGGKAFVGGDGKAHSRRFTRPALRSWKGAAQVHMIEAMKGHEIPTGPLRVTIVAGFACPKSKHRKRTPREAEWNVGVKDVDNIAKAVLDAGNGVLYVDDRQVAELLVTKVTLAQGVAPRVRVTISTLKAEPVFADDGSRVR